MRSAVNALMSLVWSKSTLDTPTVSEHTIVAARGIQRIVLGLPPRSLSEAHATELPMYTATGGKSTLYEQTPRRN